MFHFDGDAILSKSWLNRAQVIRYFNPQFSIENFAAEADDVKSLESAIREVGKTDKFDLGLGGTSLRFFVFLLSRTPGHYKVFANSKLLARPQQGLADLLEQLGVEIQFFEDHLSILSSGWKIDRQINTGADVSSQFVSGLLLSSWNLSEPLTVRVTKPVVSFDYLRMTLNLLLKAGMQIESVEDDFGYTFTVPANQTATATNMVAEPDVSSIFSLAAAAVVDGDITVRNWQITSSQPDISFLRVFSKMGIEYSSDQNQLRLTKHNSWKGLLIDLNNSPDLFPVLSVMCALGEGVSRLSGAKHLSAKESNRIKKTAELLLICGFRFEELEDGLVIYGKSSEFAMQESVDFDPSHDHRMAMAAGILKLAGYKINVLDPEVVDKSYPGFWKDIGL